jgi:hypothetical protein
VTPATTRATGTAPNIAIEHLQVLSGGTPPPAMLAAIAVALSRTLPPDGQGDVAATPSRPAPAWRTAALHEAVTGVRVTSRARLTALPAGRPG